MYCVYTLARINAIAISINPPNDTFECFRAPVIPDFPERLQHLTHIESSEAKHLLVPTMEMTFA